MTRDQQACTLATQAEVYSLSSLIQCVRFALEGGSNDMTIASALASCEDVATRIADKMDAIPGLNDKPGDAA